MSIYDGVKDAEVQSAKGEFLLPGRYLLKVTSTKEAKSRTKGPMVTIMGDVILHLKEESESKVGSQFTLMEFTQSQYFLKSIKTWISTILGISAEDVDGELCTEFFNSDMAEGLFFEVNTNEQTTVATRTLAPELQKHYNVTYTQRAWTSAELKEAEVSLTEDEIAKIDTVLG